MATKGLVLFWLSMQYVGLKQGVIFALLSLMGSRVGVRFVLFHFVFVFVFLLKRKMRCLS